MKYYFYNVELIPVFENGSYNIKVGDYGFSSQSLDGLYKAIGSVYPIHNSDKLAEECRQSLADRVKSLLESRNSPSKPEIVSPKPSTLSQEDLEEILQRQKPSSLSELKIEPRQPTAEELVDILQHATFLEDKQNALRLLWLMSDPLAVKVVAKIQSKSLSQIATNITNYLNKYDFVFVTRVEISELCYNVLQQAEILKELAERLVWP